MKEPLISVIIPVKDGQNTIEKCLGSILSLDYGNYEVIVVDDGSQDKTPEILKKYCQKIRIISEPLSMGPSKARNIASLAAKGEYLAFTDADCIVDKMWLRELLSGFTPHLCIGAGFTESNIVSVGGRQEAPADESKFGRRVFKFMQRVGFITDYIHKAEEEIKSVPHNPSCNVMYKKDIFLKEGGFLEGLWPGEDVELDYRLREKGYKVVFNPKAIIYHYRPDNLQKFCQMMYRYGSVQGFLVRRYGIFRRIHLFSIMFVVLALLFILCMLYNIKITTLVMTILIVGALFYFSLNIILLCLGLAAILFWYTGFIRGFINYQH